MDFKKYLLILKEYIAFCTAIDDAKSVFGMLYECYSESYMMDDSAIKTDFDELYQCMNGMDLKEMDKIIYPVCTLCRDHQRTGFVAGIKVGVMLSNELGKL